MNPIKNFINDESGVTAIEHALIAALIAVVATTAMSSVGTKLTSLFNSIAGKLP